MDWPRPQPESSYLWDQVPQLRCYLYDPTSSHISTSLSRSLAFRSLSSRFSFSPSLSFSLSPFPPPLSPCRSLALFLRSYSLPALCFASSFHFHSVPRYLSSTLLLRALYPPGRSSRYLPAARFAFFKVIYPLADALSLECQIVVRLYPRNRHRGFVALRAFDRTPDSTAMMRENHKRLLLSRCTISVLMDTKTFQLRTMKRYRF